LVAVVTFDGSGLILLCLYLRFRVWFHQTDVNVFHVSIRTTENYKFDKIRTAGVAGNATNYKNSQGVTGFGGLSAPKHSSKPPQIET